MDWYENNVPTCIINLYYNFINLDGGVHVLNMMKSIIKKSESSGFTLVELLVVIAIIGMLSSIGAYSYNLARDAAKIAKAKADIDEIRKSIEALGNDTNTWPGFQELNVVGTAEGNEICNDGPNYGLSDPRAGVVATDGTYSNWSGPYMPAIPLDPWDNEYFFDTSYQISSTEDKPCSGGASCVNAVVIGSYGPDRVGNNQYNVDDVIRILLK